MNKLSIWLICFIMLVMTGSTSNALVAAETMIGINGNTKHAIPHDRLQQVMKKYNR